MRLYGGEESFVNVIMDMIGSRKPKIEEEEGYLKIQMHERGSWGKMNSQMEFLLNREMKRVELKTIQEKIWDNGDSLKYETAFYFVPGKNFRFGKFVDKRHEIFYSGEGKFLNWGSKSFLIFVFGKKGDQAFSVINRFFEHIKNEGVVSEATEFLWGETHLNVSMSNSPFRLRKTDTSRAFFPILPSLFLLTGVPVRESNPQHSRFKYANVWGTFYGEFNDLQSLTVNPPLSSNTKVYTYRKLKENKLRGEVLFRDDAYGFYATTDLKTQDREWIKKVKSKWDVDMNLFNGMKGSLPVLEVFEEKPHTFSADAEIEKERILSSNLIAKGADIDFDKVRAVRRSFMPGVEFVGEKRVRVFGGGVVGVENGGKKEFVSVKTHDVKIYWRGDREEVWLIPKAHFRDHNPYFFVMNSDLAERFCRLLHSQNPPAEFENEKSEGEWEVSL